MRSHYADGCARTPLNALELLEVSKARRATYVETVPVPRQMIMETQFALGQQRTLDMMDSTNRAMGQIQKVTRQSPGVYNMLGVGFGVWFWFPIPRYCAVGEKMEGS